jgi:hypothetical protein
VRPVEETFRKEMAEFRKSVTTKPGKRKSEGQGGGGGGATKKARLG